MRLLLVKTGDTADSIQRACGDFDRMFLDQIGDLIDVRVVHAHQGEPLPPVKEVDAMLMTGSPYSVTTLEPWAESLSRWTRDLVDADRPVLGVCYGHQLLAHALGGRVERNPLGYEIGTITVSLTPEGENDPLLGRLDGRPLRFNSVHADAVTELPEGATILATNERTAVQAYSVGDRVWGVQFHPEITKRIMEMYLEERRYRVVADAHRAGEDPEAAVEEVRRGIEETPQGSALLRAFILLAKEKLGG